MILDQLGRLSMACLDELWRRSYEHAEDVVFRGWDEPDAPEPWRTMAEYVYRPEVRSR